MSVSEFMNIFFDESKVSSAKTSLKESFWQEAFLSVKKMADESLSFKPESIKGIFMVPDFYKDRIGRDKAVKPLEETAVAMIALSNIYLITREEQYAQKIVELTEIWTNSITDYGTDQAQYEANWNFQIMGVAISSLEKNKDSIKNFIDYDYHQCLKLENLNQRTNNLRTWLGAHMIVSAINKADNNLFNRACELYKKAISEEVVEEGYMPKEASRGSRGIHYTFFALDALFFIAEAALNQGVNLYEYQPGGKFLKKATEYILPYVYEPEKWPWSSEEQDFSVFPQYHSGWCEVAYQKWRLKGLEKFLLKNRPIFDPSFGGSQTLFNGIKI